MILTASAEQPEPLQALGLTVDNLHDSLRAGERERRTCTKFDARSAPGFMMWTRTLRALREILVPLGWRSVDLNQLPLVVNADRTVGIAVSSGDAITGTRVWGVEPRTRYPKGAMTQVVVKRNEQLALFPDPEEPPEGNYANLRTYVLLLYVAKKARELRSELSLPAAIGLQGKIDSWAQRILLPSIQLGAEVELLDDDEPGDVDVFTEPRE